MEYVDTGDIQSVDGVLAGETIVVVFEGGGYYSGLPSAIVDPSDTVLESDETNNVFTPDWSLPIPTRPIHCLTPEVIQTATITQSILSPTPTIPTKTPSPTSTPTPSPTPTPTPQVHVIRDGETLSKIANKYAVTTKVLQQLNGIVDPNQISAGQQLIVSGIVIDRKIVVDVSDQHLVAYENGEPINEFVVSTGREGSETLRGDFYIENHIDNAWGATWEIDMPYWMGFYWAHGLQNGFHGQPVDKEGLRMWEGYVGTPVSYGCIVMADNNAEWLYNWAKVGTAVTITD